MPTETDAQDRARRARADIARAHGATGVEAWRASFGGGCLRRFLESKGLVPEDVAPAELLQVRKGGRQRLEEPKPHLVARSQRYHALRRHLGLKAIEASSLAASPVATFREFRRRGVPIPPELKEAS